MPLTALDKATIAFQTPYAIGNAFAPEATWKNVAPGLMDTPQKQKLARFFGPAGAFLVGTKWATANADKATQKKMDRLCAGVYLANIPLVAAVNEKEDAANRGMKAFNIASLAVLGGMHIKQSMDR